MSSSTAKRALMHTGSPDTPQKPRRPVPRRAIILLAAVLVFCLLAVILGNEGNLPNVRLCRTTEGFVPPKLNIVTYATGRRIDHRMDHAILEHNCAMVAKTHHRYFIYTEAENLDKPYCRVCECHVHVPTNCPCPVPVPNNKCMCEKQQFYVARLHELGHIVWHDSELVILRDDFLDKLAVKTMIYDFLAAYIPTGWKPTQYFAYFNSGLFFLRKVPGADFSYLKREMYESKTNSDQKVLTRFVHRYIKNWDTLSVRWHCRFLTRVGYDIPPSECMVLHDRTEIKEVFAKLNYTLLKLE